MSFKSLIIFPKHLFEEWKTIVDNEQRLSTLDKKIKKIMNMKNISDDRKWFLYKHQLMNASKFKLQQQKQKQQTENEKINALNIKLQQQQQQENEKINRLNMKLQQQQENEKINAQKINKNQIRKQQQNIATQTIDLQPNPEEIFETDFKLTDFDLNDDEKMFIDDEGDQNSRLNKNIYNEDLEYALHEEAQRQLETKNPNVIVRRNDSLGKDFRIFENKDTGERVDIEVEPIFRKLYNESDDEGENKRPSPVKKTRTKRIYPQTYTYATRSQLSKAITPKELAEEKIKLKSGTRSVFEWEGLQ